MPLYSSHQLLFPTWSPTLNLILAFLFFNLLLATAYSTVAAHTQSHNLETAHSTQPQPTESYNLNTQQDAASSKDSSQEPLALEILALVGIWLFAQKIRPVIFGYDEEPEARRRREWEIQTLAMRRREWEAEAMPALRREARREARTEEAREVERVSRRAKTRAR